MMGGAEFSLLDVLAGSTAIGRKAFFLAQLTVGLGGGALLKTAH